MLLYSLSVISCGSGNALKLWEDFEYVYDRHGTVESYSIAHEKPFVCSWFSLNGLAFALQYTPPGKIDQIIGDNPDWEFVFYCGCNQSDSLVLQQLLDAHDCSFPIILDSDNELGRINYDNSSYGSITTICGPDGTKLGSGVIGTSMSFFDSSFEDAKIRLGLH